MDALRNGDLDIVFCVDMFNEGVDVPLVDTVLMLRPTESSIVWMQQLGRGLRVAAGKSHLVVIDYIGNHRIFLRKLEALAGLLGREEQGQGALRDLLEAIGAGRIVLPPGCAVTYDLEAHDILGATPRCSTPSMPITSRATAVARRRWRSSTPAFHRARARSADGAGSWSASRISAPRRSRSSTCCRRLVAWSS